MSKYENNILCNREENQNIRVIDWGVIGLSFRFSDGFSSPDSRVTLTVESKTLKSLTTPCDACGWPGTSHVYNGRNLCEIDFQVRKSVVW